MFYKLISNNMIIDLLTETNYIYYLSITKRFINTDSQTANAILGSDHNTIYHLVNKPYNFDTELNSVELIKISEEEYEKLQNQFAIQQQENINMKNEIISLKEQINSQNSLLQSILEKLS